MLLNDLRHISTSYKRGMLSVDTYAVEISVVQILISRMSYLLKISDLLSSLSALQFTSVSGRIADICPQIGLILSKSLGTVLEGLVMAWFSYLTLEGSHHPVR